MGLRTRRKQAALIIQPATAPVPPTGLAEIVDDILALCKTDRVSMGDLLAAFGATGFLPALLIPAVIVLSPLSGIPILPSICGMMIFLVACQMLGHRRSLWLPGWLRRRGISSHRLRSGIVRLRRPALWLDAHSGQRLRLLTRQPMLSILQLACALCGFAMPFLELVPFSSSLLAMAVCLMCLAMMTRDGLWALVALIPVASAGAVLLSLWG
ncbi:exopolysaccharide biosynthesis protein [Rhodophyticola sp. CCM32]|uniref:exopolysaccharide biosynthesis protein n=1 Tax=Rhodophyticola sp. CCM32 TaxID=2916397 RepID=UPI00107F4D7A|nr:exopolysaccharide biosynthesis protein [Rhodophyticola sp. CCM32]QBX99516.1 exopolysaccharide biosynthesis protein [Rhodophyticola sp. CCM32]